jgi:predicted amidophosphoribosyltransferase
VTYPGPAGKPLGFPNCPDCTYRNQGASTTCIACALQTVPAVTGPRCPVCTQSTTIGPCRNRVCAIKPEERGFARVAAISIDPPPLDHRIREFKYDGVRGWGLIFGRLILGWLDRNTATAAAYTHIVANPSYLGRRPYQHIELMLTAAATEDVLRRWPIFPRALIKPVETEPSAGRSLAAKLAAAKAHAAALQLAPPPDSGPSLAGAKILLVDDIFTTGAQLHAVGRRFLHAGAAHVDGLVIARHPWSN